MIERLDQDIELALEPNKENEITILFTSYSSCQAMRLDFINNKK